MHQQTHDLQLTLQESCSFIFIAWQWRFFSSRTTATSASDKYGQLFRTWQLIHLTNQFASQGSHRATHALISSSTNTKSESFLSQEFWRGAEIPTDRYDFAWRNPQFVVINQNNLELFPGIGFPPGLSRRFLPTTKVPYQLASRCRNLPSWFYDARQNVATRRKSAGWPLWRGSRRRQPSLQESMGSLHLWSSPLYFPRPARPIPPLHHSFYNLSIIG